MNTLFFNNYEKLYGLICSDQRFKCTIVITDCYLNDEVIITQESISEILDAKNIPYIYEINRGNGTSINYRELNPDFIFFQTPYPETRPNTPHPSILRKFTDIYYISYGYSLVDYSDENYSGFFTYNSFFSYCNGIFLECTLIKNYFKKYIPDNLYAVGNLKNLLPLPKAINSIEGDNSNHNFHVVAWKPRWVGNIVQSGFFKYLFVLLDFFDENQNINLKICLHPLFLSTLKNNNLYGDKFILNLFKRIDDSKNIELLFIESDNDQNELLSADLFISDISSTIVDFLSTGKPVIITLTDIKLNPFGNAVQPYAYKTSSTLHLLKLIRSIVEGKDPLLASRNNLFDLLFETDFLDNKNSPENNVLEIILRNLRIQSKLSGYENS